MSEIIVKFEKVVGGNHIASVYVNELFAFDVHMYAEDDSKISYTSIDSMCDDSNQNKNLFDEIKKRQSPMPYLMRDDELSNLTVIRDIIIDAFKIPAYEK